MDSRIGLDYIVENKDYTTKLAAGVLGWGQPLYYLQCTLISCNILTDQR